MWVGNTRPYLLTLIFEYINVFNQLDIAIKPGEKVGLVGRSGAGKSTLVNLLMRFYDTNSGEIRIDGQPVKSVSQETLREKISMVTQDTSLMHRSVRDNIIYGRTDATEEEMIEAAIAEAAAAPTLPPCNLFLAALLIIFLLV